MTDATHAVDGGGDFADSSADPTTPGEPLEFFAVADDYLQRMAIGLAVSLFVHIGALLLAFLLLAGGHSGDQLGYITISVGDEQPLGGKDPRDPGALEEATQSQEPTAEAIDVAPDVDIDADAERLAEAVDAATTEDASIMERLEASEAARREAERAARREGMAETDARVGEMGDLGTRGDETGGADGLAPGEFFGQKIQSRRVIFLLDISISMDIEQAKRNLRNAYHELGPETYFGIAFFYAGVDVWRSTLVRATPENVRSADEFVSRITETRSGTNVHAALRVAFDMSQRSTVRADTIYFLTDGFPTVGPTLEFRRILADVERWNRNAEVMVHAIQIINAQTVALHATPIDDAQDFMRQLAEDTNGIYVLRR